MLSAIIGNGYRLHFGPFGGIRYLLCHIGFSWFFGHHLKQVVSHSTINGGTDP